jgi:hypothetical protein
VRVPKALSQDSATAGPALVGRGKGGVNAAHLGITR